jgi:hypothetical protein
MAKSREVLPTVASIEYLYHSFDQIHWAQIEERACKVFPASERKEIHYCTDRYSHEASWIDGAAPANELFLLRNESLRSCEALCALAERFQPAGGAPLGSDERKVMESLAILHNIDGDDLREAFHSAARAAQRLSAYLRNRDNFPSDRSPRHSETVGLVHFLAAVWRAQPLSQHAEIPRMGPEPQRNSPAGA